MRSYTLPAFGFAGVTSLCVVADQGCADFMAEAGEKTLDISVEDDSGLPVSAVVLINPGEDDADQSIPFCEEIVGLRVKRYDHVTVYLENGPRQTCQGTATAGKIVATFWKIRIQR